MQLSTVKSKNNSFTYSFLFWIIALVTILIFVIVGAIAIGSTYIEPKVVYKILLNKLSNGHLFTVDWNVMFESIVWEIRFPRVILGGVCGAGLALCGILMQCVTKNPIAEPYVLGISSGASAGAVSVLV